MSAGDGKKTRKLISRLAVLVVYCGLIFLMALTGRSHTVLIDNKDAEDGTSYLAVDGMSVQIDRQESAEYYPGDRDKAVVKGQSHHIKVEIFADGTIVEKNFKVPFGQNMVLLSVPKMLAGIEPYIEPFSIQLEQESAAFGQPEGQQFGGEGTAPAEGAPTVPSLQQ